MCKCKRVVGSVLHLDERPVMHTWKSLEEEEHTFRKGPWSKGDTYCRCLGCSEQHCRRRRSRLSRTWCLGVWLGRQPPWLPASCCGRRWSGWTPTGIRSGYTCRLSQGTKWAGPVCNPVGEGCLSEFPWLRNQQDPVTAGHRRHRFGKSMIEPGLVSQSLTALDGGVIFI